MFRRLFYVGVLFVSLGISPVQSLTIEITGGEEGALPIAIVPFGGNSPVNIAEIITNDLQHTGYFAPLAEKDIISHPHRAEEVRFEDWRLLGVESLVIGLVQGGTVQFELFNVMKGNRLTGLSFNVGSGNLRRVAHKISDVIYQQLTGNRGAFNTRIAYISAGIVQGRRPNTYSLKISDADGYNSQTVLTSKEPLLSPAWSPDGTRLAYVSFENRHPWVYIQDLRTGKRDIIANYPGSNSAPAWSPDGQSLALSLSKDGNAEIYLLNIATRALRRLTNNIAIDTEPAWSPDGSTIVFTSDRGGSPQIYRVSINTGSEERLTFEGSYNAHPQFSPDGRQIALVHGNGAVHHIGIIELGKKTIRTITRTNLDESPSFAPNGTMIIYSTEENGRGVLKIVSVDGRTPQRLGGLENNETREPAWSPVNRKLEE